MRIRVGGVAVDLVARRPRRGARNIAGLDDDQRGPGFARVVGAVAAIGAFELQPTNETIFANGFD